ncbi:MAG TPA: CHAT domain-containing protein [Allosphingosinicella sp.]|nr:CHAT domain-containing protein [Allosphingosinicella sp.]
MPRRTQAEYRKAAFEAAQWAFRTEAAIALDRVAARFAAGGDEIARLETELQRIRRAIRSSEDALTDTFRRQGVENEGARRDLRARIETLERLAAEKSAQIQRQFPDYSELVRPQTYSLEAVSLLLRADEGLLLIVNAEDATYLFAVSRDRYEWYRTADLGREEVDRAVARLRAALTAESHLSTPFDRALAHRLYRGLIAPANEIVGDKRIVMTITSGTLATLPLNVLVTEAPTGSDSDREALARTRWLADRHIVASLPAISSLVALRCHMVDSAQRSQGCPSAGPSRVSQPRVESAPAVTLAAAGAPVLLGRTMDRRRGNGSIDQIFHQGDLADPEFLRNAYPPLPGARQELVELRRRYGSQAHILIDRAATEGAVKQGPQFRTARFVLFATHGVLAARAASTGEPGLVFTPPASGRQDARDDGFLSASEVAALRFNADLVVLSACNTAVSEGQLGSEGLSALARSFFYAGARSLLASHWEVDDEATRLLMTTAFDAIHATNGRDRGEAVRRAMQRVRRTPSFAHPRYWAAFTLIGEAS